MKFVHCIFIFLFMFLNIFFCFFQMASSSTTTARARRPTRWPPASNCRWPNTPAKTKNHFYRFKRNFGWKKVTLYWSKDLTIALKITAPVLFLPRAKFFKKIISSFCYPKFSSSCLKWGLKADDLSTIPVRFSQGRVLWSNNFMWVRLRFHFMKLVYVHGNGLHTPQYLTS